MVRSALLVGMLLAAPAAAIRHRTARGRGNAEVVAAAEAVSREHILHLVHQSPQRAGAHDKAGWLDLYAADASVEDPVGTGAMVGHDEIGGFYDAFIADTNVSFTQVFQSDSVTRSAVCTQADCSAAVARWVEITSTLYSGLVVKVEAVLVYEVVGTPSGLRIASLNTYWPLKAQMDQVLAQGWLGWTTSLGMFQSILVNLGVSGSWWYANGFRSIGDAGGLAMRSLMQAVSLGDQGMFSGLMGNSTYQMPYGHTVSAEGAWETLTRCQCDISDIQTASFFAAATLECVGGRVKVLRLTFDSGFWGDNRVLALDGFWEDEGEGGAGCGKA